MLASTADRLGWSTEATGPRRARSPMAHSARRRAAAMVRQAATALQASSPSPAKMALSRSEVSAGAAPLGPMSGFSG